MGGLVDVLITHPPRHHHITSHHIASSSTSSSSSSSSSSPSSSSLSTSYSSSQSPSSPSPSSHHTTSSHHIHLLLIITLHLLLIIIITHLAGSSSSSSSPPSPSSSHSPGRVINPQHNRIQPSINRSTKVPRLTETTAHRHVHFRTVVGGGAAAMRATPPAGCRQSTRASGERRVKTGRTHSQTYDGAGRGYC